MQRKQFVLIASIINEIPDPIIREVVANHFAIRLQSTNPNFNYDKFIKACLK